MKKAILLHGLLCHYEMLGSIMEQFKDEYELYLYSPICQWLMDWLGVYHNLGIKLNVINVELKEENRKDFDLVIIDTDDDKGANEIYEKIFKGLPCYVINHLKEGNRSYAIPSDCKIEMNIHGIQEYNTPFHFSGYKYVKTLEEKLSHINGKRIAVAILGDMVNEENDFLTLLKKRFTNFDDIDFYICNRFVPYWKTNEYKNIKYYLNCNSILCFKILCKCHYVYYLTLNRGVNTASGCVGMAYATLCKLILNYPKDRQYEASSALMKKYDDVFELKPITKDDIEEVNEERELFLEKTRHFIKTTGLLH